MSLNSEFRVNLDVNVPSHFETEAKSEEFSPLILSSEFWAYFRRPFAFAFQSRIGLRKYFVFRLLIDGDLRSETRRNHSEKRSRQRIATAISRKIEEFFPLGSSLWEKLFSSPAHFSFPVGKILLFYG